MAKVMVEAMEQLGHVHFALAGHDRGGRVSYRLALDHPGRLSKLAVLDIAPTYDYWEKLNRLSALKIYHWAFLAQPYPLPETLIAGNGEFFLRQKMASQTKSKTLDAIDPRALEHYLAPFRDPSRIHAMCEDYRAGAYADYEIDKADFDAGKKITIPMLALWGDAGVASAATTPLDTWKKWATKVEGAPVDSGHFLPEENPEVTAKLLREFFLAVSRCTQLVMPAKSGASSTPRPLDQSRRLWNTGSSAFADDDAELWGATSYRRTLKKSLQQRRGFGLAYRRIDLRHVMAGRLGKEPHPGIHRAALGIGGAVIEPPDPRKRNRARAHRAGLQRDVEVAVDQPLGPDGFSGLPDRQDFGVRGRVAVGQGPVAGAWRSPRNP